jgi:hypothetical protein
MKVSVLAILATATLATASVIPSCDRTDVDSLSEYKPLCRNVCLRVKPPCPKGWHPALRLCPIPRHPVRRGWTCCKNIPHPHGFEFEEEEFEGFDEFDELD